MIEHIRGSGKAVGKLLLAASFASLMACSSPTEKATRFYEKGLALMKAGDFAKARIELQNALQIKQDMSAAWYALAEIAEQQGDWQKMYGLLGKVVDYDPKNIDAQIKLGRLLLASGQLDKALAASDTALKLAPDRDDVLALRAAVLYKLENTKEALAQANAALTKNPNNIDALIVLATERLAAKDPAKAIEYLDRGLKQNDKNSALELMKVQALVAMSQMDAAEKLLHKMASDNPQARAFRHMLAQFYLTQGRKDAAEAEYRAVAAENPKDISAQLDLVRFIGALKGQKAAMQELETLASKDASNVEMKFALANAKQAQGDAAAAEGIYRAIIEKAGDQPDGLKAKSMLAAMTLAKGDKAAAQKLVDEVLAKDQRNEEGLLLKASLEMDARKLDEAIADLRTILRDSPSSPRALLMLAKAHELAGSDELAQENYVKAYQAGKSSPAVGMPYAEFLSKRGQMARVDQVAQEMLQVAPGYVPALKLLAQAKISQGDWTGAQAIADQLAKDGNQTQIAEQIRGAIFAARKDYADSIGAFKRAYEAAPNATQPLVALVRSYIAAGKNDEALAFLDSVIKASPNNTSAHLLQGQILAMKGNAKGAAQAFQTVIGQQPKEAAGYAGLANIQLRSGQTADAEKTIAQGLAAIPGDLSLRMLQAETYETTGRVDDAIKAYEDLLKAQPNADIVANNLASLLVDHRTDKASLSRAYDIAQRFKRSDVPQFKDTLGWAAYRMGKAGEAVPLIEDAVKKLPDLAVFHYHLGMSYLATNKKDAAKKELEKALELGKRGGFAEAEQAKEALGKL